MKIISIYIGIIISLISVSFLTSGCSDEYEYSTDYSGYNGVQLSIDLVDQDNVLTLNLINGTYNVKVNVTPENIIIGQKGFIYEIADETIATISNEGAITMLKDGETELTVKFRGNPEISTKCTLKIRPILTEKLNLPQEPVVVEEEKTIDLMKFISVTPSEASKKFAYQIADGTIASVSEDGIVTGLKEGETKITVTTTDGTNLTGEIALKVVGKIFITNVNFPEEKVEDKSFVVGQVLNLSKFVEILPENASEPLVKYTLSGDEGVVSITEDGTVTCLSDGEATITIAANDNNPTPIEAKELKIKVVATGWYERSLWIVDTSYRFDAPGDALGEINYIPDKDKGMPEQLIDGNNSTYLTYLKPNMGPFNGYEQHNTEHYLTIDMGGETEFNSFKYVHRNTSNKNWQVWKISIYGSNDNENYSIIKDNIELDKNTLEKIYNIPNAKYRYIKVEFLDWDKTSGYNMCIAEFNVSKQ